MAATRAWRASLLSGFPPVGYEGNQFPPHLDPVISMDTEATYQRVHRGGSPMMIFITSFCAAICMAIGIGIIFEAFIVAAAKLFELGSMVLWVGTAINVVFSLWLFVWTFVRSWHVERRLREGLDVDEPKLSILANLRGS